MFKPRRKPPANRRVATGGSTPGAAVLCAAAIAAAFASTTWAGDPPRFTAELITPGLSAINAAAMNESADVVGTIDDPTIRGWVSLGGRPATLLPLPPGAASSWAMDINDQGVIAGAVSPTMSPEYRGRAATWTPDGAGGYTIEEFGTLPGDVQSIATALNNVGDIVGWSNDGMYSVPVLFTPDGVESLAETRIFDPVDVNDQRQVIDHSHTVKRLDLDTMIVEDLGKPPHPGGGQIGYLGTRGEAINESGQVAGSAILSTSTPCDQEAACFTDGIGWEILSICGSNNSAWDINDLGDVVMRLNVAPYVRFEGLGTFRIEDLIEEDEGHWFVINGFGLTINNARQMAVPASNDQTGEGGIILLTRIVGGDLNGDGKIDAADFVAWRKNDGTQNGHDTWRANFGRTVGDGSASNATVPEPASTILFVLGVAAVRWRRRLASRVPKLIGRDIR